MYVFLCVSYCVVMSKPVSNRKRRHDAKDVVICVIVPSLASPHLVKWYSGFDQHSLNRSQFVEVFVFHRVNKRT